MARIIPLKRDLEPTGDDAASPQGCVGEPAQIILFPGVRYERWHDEQQAKPAGGCHEKAPKARDWLDV